MAMVCSVGDAGNSCLSRCFDKIFEDAQLSGVLQLNGRSLKTLPPHANQHDLSDTLFADVSRNRLLDFPVELKQCGFLETLHLENNCIRSVPNYVASLTSLTYLDLSFNQIQQLPAALFTLPLEVLLVKSGRLESLPNEIEKLAPTLAELDVSCNRLIALPGQIGALSQLRVFNARDNLLTRLPYEFCQLRLLHCDLSFNRIVEIEADLRLMTTLVAIWLEGNPLHYPAPKVCARGRDHLFKALEAKATSGGDQRRRGRPSLLPTNPTDMRYLSAHEPSSISRRRTLDSGYSTLTEEVAKLELDVNCDEKPFANGARILPLPGASFFNGATMGREGGPAGGSMVDEVMSACMERFAVAERSNEDYGSFPVPPPNCDTPKTTPRSVKSEVIQALYTKSALKSTELAPTTTVPVSSPTISDKALADRTAANQNGASFASPESDDKKTARRLFYAKAPQQNQTVSSTTKVQRLQRRASLKSGVDEGKLVSSVELICNIMEERLRVKLPRCDEKLAEKLSDGVLLCDFLNALRPRTVNIVHMPSDSTAVVPAAKARRNLENFLTGCRRLGVQEEVVPLYEFVLHQNVELTKLTRLIQALTMVVAVHVEANPSSPPPLPVLTLRQHLMAYGLIIFFISYLLHRLNNYH